MTEIITQLALTYGPLGAWVAVSIYQSKKAADTFEEERRRWDQERSMWLKTLGRRLSDRTIDEVTRR